MSNNNNADTAGGPLTVLLWSMKDSMFFYLFHHFQFSEINPFSALAAGDYLNLQLTVSWWLFHLSLFALLYHRERKYLYLVLAALLWHYVVFAAEIGQGGLTRYIPFIHHSANGQRAMKQKIHEEAVKERTRVDKQNQQKIVDDQPVKQEKHTDNKESLYTHNTKQFQFVAPEDELNQIAVFQRRMATKSKEMPMHFRHFIPPTTEQLKFATQRPLLPRTQWDKMWLGQGSPTRYWQRNYRF